MNKAKVSKKAKAKNEIPAGETAMELHQKQKGKIAEALLNLVLEAKNSDSGDLVFAAHDEVLPNLLAGWVASDECVQMEPGLRAATINYYTGIMQLLTDIDEVAGRFTPFKNFEIAIQS